MISIKFLIKTLLVFLASLSPSPTLAPADARNELLDCLAVRIVAHKTELAWVKRRDAEEPFGPKPTLWTFENESRVKNLEREITGKPSTYKLGNDTFEIALSDDHEQTYVMEKFEELDVRAQKAFADRDWSAIYDLRRRAGDCPARGRNRK